MRRRTLRLLDAGRAPAAWMRGSERAGARLHALERGTAWAPALAAVRPALRQGPLLGGALDALASADPGSASSSPADAPAAPPAPSRRGDPSASPRRRAGKSDAPSAEGPGDAAPRPRTPRERRAASPLAAERHRPRLATLPRHADEGVLRRWSGPVAGASTGGAMEWDEIVRRAARAALTSSPHALPTLAVADRLAGWRNAVGSPAAPPLPSFDRVVADAAGPAFGGEARGGRWIGTVARRAMRRFLRGVAAADGSAVDARRPAAWRDSADPHRPLLADASGGIDPADRRFGGSGADDPHRPRLADASAGIDATDRRFGGSGGDDPHRPRLADASAGIDSGDRRSGGSGADDPHRPLLADASGGIDAADRRFGGSGSDDPHRPLLADASGGIDSADRRFGGSGADDPHRPHLADVSGAIDSAEGRGIEVESGDPHRPWLADVEEGGPSDTPRLALEWDAPLDGPAAPADVLARLASGRPRAPAQGTADESARRAPANAAASLLRQARRRAAGGDGGSADGDAEAAPSIAPGGRSRGHRPIHVPSLVRELAERAGSSEGTPRPIRAVATAEGLLRPSAHPLFATAGGGARNREDGAEAALSTGDGRDRWVGWPAVLPWPRGLRTAPVDAPDGRRAATKASASAGAARPRRAADASGGEQGPAAPASPSAAPAAEAGTPRGPIPTAGELYRPAGPLPPTMTPGPFPPRAAVVGEAAPDPAAAEAARLPAPLVTGEDVAPWAEGWGNPVSGPHAAGHPFVQDAARAAEELDDALARRLKRILDDEARRYGIDV